MLNHARCLLINLDGAGVELAPFGEYSPPAYRAVALPPDLAAVADALYNGSADRGLRNYFAALYLTLLHGGDYADHALADDPRVTYWPFDPTTLPGFGATATMLPGGGLSAAGVGYPALDGMGSPLLVAGGLGGGGGGGPATLYLSGTPAAAAGARTIADSWTVTLAGPSTLAIARGGAASPATLAYTDGLSAPVPLPGSSLAVAVPAGVRPGTAWAVASYLRPAEGLADVLARLDGLHAASKVALFGAAPAGPSLTYSNLFYRADTTPDRLAGALLALIRRTAELGGA